MKNYRVGIIGATGMVGQRFTTLLENHPWFHVTALLASASSAGRTYREAVEGRWAMKTPIPAAMADMVIRDAADIDGVKEQVDFVFFAVNIPKAQIREMEEAYAKAEIPVISNNSACRGLDDVPMIIPELNADHARVIETQRRRLGTRRGFVAVKSNCSIQSYVPALTPLKERFGLTKVLACTYQAISGAGKTFETWPEMVDNVIPYIGGEEEKSEKEPMKVWGSVQGDEIVSAAEPVISAQCLRVPVSDGHTAAAFVKFKNKPTKEQILEAWANYSGRAQELNLPSAPKQFLHYFEEDDRPQARLDRNLEGGMAVSIGRLRDDVIFDYRFVSLSHNTLRGAAGGAVELAELLCAEGYMD